MCDCEVCQQSRAFYKYLDTVPAESRDYFVNLYDALLEAEEDRCYYRALLDGSWPDADKVIENWRKRKNNDIH